MTIDAVAARTPDGHTLFDNLTLSLARERTGVVGRNGAGKTTLLDLIEGLAEPAEGAISRAGTVARLPQAPLDWLSVAEALGVAGPLTVIDRVLAGKADERDLADADWTLEARIGAALAEVGLDGLDPWRPTDALSGGERTRLALAALILKAPDLILLDEPTNHLDVDGRRLVGEVLERWPGGAVVVSHDRALLRRMDRILELSPLGPTLHGGGWDLYAERKATETAAASRNLDLAERETARVAREAQTARERQARRDRAGRMSRRHSSDPKILLDARAERAEATGARLNRLGERRGAEAEADLAEARDRVERTRALAPPMPPTGLASGRTVLRLEAVELTAGGRRLAGPLDLRLTGPERLAVIGPNGSGKSSLLRVMAGEIHPASGWAETAVPAVLLDQDARLLRPDKTLMEAYRRLNPEVTPNQAQAALARFLFRNAAAQRIVATLSGGERLRAALACVMTGARPPQLLLLDEPTNHLDLDSLQAIEAALAAYDGALVVVSHDKDFLAAVGCSRSLRLGPEGGQS